MVLHVVLYQPEIPPNTGNIIRLCANSGAQLHLVHPLGFDMEEKKMRRAKLDYEEWVSVLQYSDWQDFVAKNPQRRILACSTKSQQRYCDVSFQAEDMLLFGPETRGLPAEILQDLPQLANPHDSQQPQP